MLLSGAGPPPFFFSITQRLQLSFRGVLPWAPVLTGAQPPSHQARAGDRLIHTVPNHKITRLELCCRLGWWQRLLSPLYPHILILPSAVKEAALIRLIITWMICSGGEEWDTKLLACVCVCSVCSLVGHTPSLVTLTHARKKEKKAPLWHISKRLWKTLMGLDVGRGGGGVCVGGYMHKIHSCPVLIDNTNAKLQAQGKTNVSRD